MPRADEVFATCSFCLKSNTEVEKLVAGPGVYICDECVSLCNEVIATTPDPGSVERVMPWENQTDLDALLANLPSIAAVGNQVEDNLVAWVARARSLGATWAQVGETLGMARQSAWERFAAKVGDASDESGATGSGRRRPKR